ncbi:MAG: hypothetical protein U9N87_07150, partial [Planctomycetota bacterium]|nr:hypothetical protein [Planctomycetota bacterium]
MRRLIPWVICLAIICGRLLPAQDSSTPVPPAANVKPAATSTEKPAELPKKDPANAPASVPTARKSVGVEEMQPPVYYVLDKHGNLVPMFGFQFEDFMRAFKQMQGLDDRRELPPRFVIEEMSVRGKIGAGGKIAASGKPAGKPGGKTAELSIRFSIRLQDKGTVRVPLGLGAAILKETGLKETGLKETGLKETGLKETGLKQTDAKPTATKNTDAKDDKKTPGRQVFEHDSQDGYVVWMEGEPGKSQQISLDVLVSLTTVGGETRLRLQSPRTTKSELRLTVVPAGMLGRVSQGATLRTTPADDGKATEFIARGLTGDFELSWHDSDVRTTQNPTVMTAAGRILARIDEHSVNTEATLEIHGHGSPFDRFRVRLPHGAELLASSPAGHSVVEVAADESKSPKLAKNDKKTKGRKNAKTNNGKTSAKETAAAATSGKSRVVEIRLRKKTLGPVKIRLATRQSHGQGSSGQLVELSGFEVLGAARQWGHIALAVADDIYVSWDQQYRVRQVDDLPEALRQEDVVAGFAYSSQPCSLKAWIVPRKTR